MIFSESRSPPHRIKSEGRLFSRIMRQGMRLLGAVAEHFGRQSAARRPALPQRFLVEGDDRSACCRERALDMGQKIPHNAFVECELAIRGKLDQHATQ